MPYIGQRPATGEANSFKILDEISSYTLTFDGSSAGIVSVANDTITEREHRFVTGQRVTYNDGGGTAITGLSDGVYYIIVEDRHTFKLASSANNAAAGTAINLTGVGVGASHTLNVAFDGVNTKFKATINNGTKAGISQSGQLMLSINGVLQEPHDNTDSPSTGYAADHTSTIIFSAAPASTDQFFGRLIATNAPTFDISDNIVDNFTGDGSTSTFTLSKTPPNNESVLVTIDGVVQYPDDTSAVRAYTVAENILSFVSAPGLAVEIQVRHIGFAGASSAGITGFYGRTGNAALKSTDNIVLNNATASGTVQAANVTVTGNLTVNGTTTTLDTDLIGVDKLEVAANNTTVAAAITQTGTGDILNLYDGSTEVFSVADGGTATFASRVNVGANDLNNRAVNAINASTTVGAVSANNHHASGILFQGYNASVDANLASFVVTSDGSTGIGTHTPARKLHVNGTSQFQDYVYGNSIHNILYVADDLALSATKKLYFDAGSNTYIHEPSGDQLAIVTGGTEKLRIDSSGRLLLGSSSTIFDNNFGIGMLQVTNKTGYQHVLISGHSAAASNATCLSVGRSRGTQASPGYLSSGDHIARFSATSYNGGNYQSSGAIDFFAADQHASGDLPGYISFKTVPDGSTTLTERLRITSDGKLLVGSIVENGSEGISDKGLVVTSDGENTLKLLDSTSYATNVGASILLGGNYRSSGDTQPFVRLKSFKENSTDNNFGYGFSISTNANGGSITERLRIDSNGKVGINQVTPTAFMHVKSGANNGTVISTFEGATNNKLDVKFISTGPAINVTAGDPLVFEMSGSEKLRITSGGQVLINDTSLGNNRADAPLQIETGSSGNCLNLRTRSSDDVYSYINFQNNAATQTAAEIYLARNASNNAGNLVFGTANPNSSVPQQRMMISSGGATSLHVNSASHETFRFTTQALNEAKLIMQDASGNSDIVLNTGGDSWFNGGDVGIGNGNPIFKLDVVDGGGGANTGANVNNPDALSVTGTNRTLTGGGANLFVNSNSDVAANTGGQIALSGRHVSSSTNSMVHATIKGAKETAVSTNANSYLAFGVSNHNVGGLVERVRIDSGGNFGIGTIDPSNARLMVVDGITTTFGNAPLAIFGSGFAAGYYSTIGFGPTNASYTVPPSGIGHVATSQTNGGFGDLVFGTRNVTTNTSPTVRLRITSGGFVNIGGNLTQTSYTAQVTRIGGNTDVMQIKGNTGNSFIRFTDTNASSDYSLGADDAQSNGFILYDRNASAYRLVVTSAGRVGINESAPGAQLTVKRANTATSGLNGVLKLKQGSATNGNSASMLFSSLDDFDVAAVNGVIETHSGSVSNNEGRLEFWTKHAGSAIAVKGKFDSEGSFFNFTTNHGIYTESSVGSGTSKYLYRAAHSSGSTIVFNVWSNGTTENTTGTMGTVSDESLKENIVDAGSQWADIKAVKFRKFNFKEETGYETHTQLGVIAQELEATSPGLIYEVTEDDGRVIKRVKSSILTNKALVALQEAMTRIETLETQNADLLTKVTALEQRLTDAGL